MINFSESIPWNLARAVAFVKAVTEVSRIPVHPNLAMGKSEERNLNSELNVL